MKHYIIALSITLSSVFAHNNNEEGILSPLNAWKSQMYSVAMNDSDRNKDRQGIWFLEQLQRGDVQDHNTVLLPDLNLTLVNVRPLIQERENGKDGKELNLSFRGLYGPIPHTIMLLQQDGVTYLNLSFNKLTGTIQEELGNLRKLRSLNLSYNHFTKEQIRASNHFLRCMKNINLTPQIMFL